MKTSTIALAALATSAQLASATFQWLDAKKFSCPSNTDNVCIQPQKEGFNWAGLNLGSFNEYKGFEFSGFKCADSFDGNQKRDHISGRTFQNKCIKGNATPEKSTAPSFGCGNSKEVEKFSVKEFQVSVEFDCELEFHYEMPDKSTCKQKSFCQKSGTIVKNTQCGGAKTVKVIFPPYNGKTSCNIGFHHVDFDCKPPTPPTPPKYTPPTPPQYTSTPTPEVSSSTPVVSSSTPGLSTTTPQVSSPTPGLSTTTPQVSSPTPGLSTTTPQVSSPTPGLSTTTPQVSSTTPGLSTTTPQVSSPIPGTTTSPSATLFTTSTVYETQISTIISCAPTVKNCPAGSTVLVTVTTAISTTICPVTESTQALTTPADSTTTPGTGVATSAQSTSTIEGVTTSTPTVYSTTTPGTGVATTSAQSTSTVEGVTSSTPSVDSTTTPGTGVATTSAQSTSTIEGVTTSTAAPTTTTSETPKPTADCPPVLPQCLNTWLFSSGCKSNTDVKCFCKDSSFTDNIYKCLAAYGASDDEVDSAQKYFQGICAEEIPGNPAIITGKNTVTVTASQVYSVPVTTVQILTTITAPCTATEGPSSGSIIPDSSTTIILSTAVTVPQVVFQTITGTSTAAVSLVQGTAPATTGAILTTAEPIVPTTFYSVPASSASGSLPKPSNPLEFTGAATKTSGFAAGGLLAAGLMAFIAIL